ncbi:MAG TPA: hypothetical protein VG713_13030 [Pirellulales bacterium]|nr:hypothetical protein [Pirellulales bacterium]
MRYFFSTDRSVWQELTKAELEQLLDDAAAVGEVKFMRLRHVQIRDLATLRALRSDPNSPGMMFGYDKIGEGASDG